MSSLPTIIIYRNYFTPNPLFQSTSSPPAELPPTVLSRGGKLAAGTEGNSGSPSTGDGPVGALGAGAVGGGP